MSKKIEMPLTSANIDALNEQAHLTFVNDQRESITVTVAASSTGTNFLKRVRSGASARLRAAADVLDAMDAEEPEGA